METAKVLIKVDAYPSGSPVVMGLIKNALTGGWIDIIEAYVGRKYGFGMWEAWFVIPESAHTERHRVRVQRLLEQLYARNNPQGLTFGEHLIRGMVLEWNPIDEEHDDAN